MDFEKKLWGEMMDGQATAMYEGQNAEIERLREETRQLAVQIEREREMQEQVIREMRANIENIQANLINSKGGNGGNTQVQ